MQFTLILSAAIFLTYVTYVFAKFGVTKSISASVYKFKNPAWFSITMMSFPIPLLMVSFEVVDSYQFLCFFASAGIMFSGAAHCFVPSKMEETVHVIGATTGIACVTLIMLTFGIIYAIIAVLFVLFVLYCHFVAKYDWYKNVSDDLKKDLNKFELFLVKLPRVNNHTTWIELVAFFMYSGSIITKI